MRREVVALWLGVTLGCYGGALISVPVPSTGIDVLGDGRDDYYEITYLPSGPLNVPVPAYLALNEVTICPAAGGCWVTGMGSRWISVTNLRDGEVLPPFPPWPDSLPARYVYTATFDLSGFNPSTLIINGRWAADGWGNDILINGKPTGVTTGDPQPARASNYATFHAFSITHASCPGGCFVDGLNRIALEIYNGGYETGVRAEFLAMAQPIPEPGTLTLLAGGLLAVWLGGRKRRAR